MRRNLRLILQEIFLYLQLRGGLLRWSISREIRVDVEAFIFEGAGLFICHLVQDPSEDEEEFLEPAFTVLVACEQKGSACAFP